MKVAHSRMNSPRGSGICDRCRGAANAAAEASRHRPAPKAVLADATVIKRLFPKAGMLKHRSPTGNRVSGRYGADRIWRWRGVVRSNGQASQLANRKIIADNT